MSIDGSRPIKPKVQTSTIDRKMRQATPIDHGLLERFLAACPGVKLMAFRNRLLLLVGRPSFLRRAELVSLQIEDIQVKADFSGAKILLRRSNTDEDALGRWLPTSPAWSSKWLGCWKRR